MGSIAARKLWTIVENVENVISIEVLCASQGVGLLRPLRSSVPLESVVHCVRERVPFATEDRVLYHDMEAVRALVANGSIVRAIGMELDS